MDEAMKLVIGWTVVVAFVFTTGVTCASLVGWIEFKHRRQQQGLYVALILQVVVGAAGGLGGLARLNPEGVREDLVREGRNGLLIDFANEALDRAGTTGTSKADVLKLVGRIEGRPGSAALEGRDRLIEDLRRLPEGPILREDASRLRSTHVLSATLRGRVADPD